MEHMSWYSFRNLSELGGQNGVVGVAVWATSLGNNFGFFLFAFFLGSPALLLVASLNFTMAITDM
jgi:hypothetical protein